MRARVRKDRGGVQPAAHEADRRGDETAGGAPDRVQPSAERHAGTEVNKHDEGQGGDLPPWPALVAATIPEGRSVTSPFEHRDGDFTRELIKAMASDAVLVMDEPTGRLTPERSTLLARGDVLFGCDDTPEHRAAMLGDGLNVFKVEGADDRLFGATYQPSREAWLKEVTEAIEQADLSVGPGTPGYKKPEQGGFKRPKDEDEDKKPKVSKAFEEMLDTKVDLLKLFDEGEERLVYGVVLEPNGVDAQGDTISPEEIREAAHKFLQEYGNVGLQHQTFINGKARILESFIAPADMLIGDQTVRKGTWLMAMRVLDDDIWKAVKSGLITGFSIGGSAIRKPA